jgi:hypothetical protein
MSIVNSLLMLLLLLLLSCVLCRQSARVLA